MNDILGDDGPLVQAFCYVMRCCADEFYAAVEGLLIGFCADEGGEEAVVDIDDLIGIDMDDKRFQNLHVTSEDEKINFVADKIEHAVLVVSTVFFAYREVEIRDPIHLSERFEVIVIADSKGDVHRQFATFPTPEQIGKTMIESGNKDSSAFALPRVVNAPLHVKRFSDGTKCLHKVWWTQREAIFGEADAHEEGTVVMVRGVLVGLYDVTMMFKDEV